VTSDKRCNTTQRLLICPPHLLSVAGLPWETLTTTFEHVENEPVFGANMRIQTWKWILTADDWSDHHWHCSLAGSQGFIFQQDDALAHTARVTQDWLQANCPGFIGKNQWPQIPQIWTHWTITSGLPWCKSTINLAETQDYFALQVALQTVWEELPQEHISKVVVNFTKRLTACMTVNGDFSHMQ